MNRTDRLLAIILELQAKKWLRAEDLAATFEVTKRTIYRDMLALAKSGVPLVSVPGQGYSLIEGYFLPPLSFTTEEAITLLLGTDIVGQQLDPQYQRAAQSASQKITAVLSDQLQQEVAYLQRSIQFIRTAQPPATDALGLLRQAITQQRTVCFQYEARHIEHGAPKINPRRVDPYGLIHIFNTWMLIAHCHHRQEIRHFRLDRMEKVALLDDTFIRPADFELQPSNEGERTAIIRAVFATEIMRRVKESPSLFQVAQEAHPDGLLVTFAVRKVEDMLWWLLGWGQHVRVLEPSALQALLVEAAQGILKHYLPTAE